MHSSEELILEWLQETRDFSAERRAEEGYRFLSEAAALLSSSLDPENALVAVARLTVPFLADWCVIDVLNPDGSIRRVASHHSCPEKRALTEELCRLGIDRSAGFGSAVVFRTGRKQFIPHVCQPAVDWEAKKSSNVRIARELGMASILAVPLTVRSEVIGAIFLVFSEQSGRSYNQRDVFLAEGLAQHAAISLHNSRLYREAQSAVRARDELLATVSHDLKNPLCAVRLNADLLKTVLSRPIPEREVMMRSIEMIRSSTRSMNRLIRDLLDASVLDAGKLKLDIRPWRVEGLFRDACHSIQSLAADKSIQIEHNTGFAGAVACDRERILQVFSNILGNAVKFSPPGKSIRVSCQQKDKHAIFAVKDEGPGIAKHDLPYIFERFWRTKDNPLSGSGLGLSISKGIIQAHRGEIWAESAETQGTTVFFQLPTAPLA